MTPTFLHSCLLIVISSYQHLSNVETTCKLYKLSKIRMGWYWTVLCIHNILDSCPSYCWFCSMSQVTVYFWGYTCLCQIWYSNVAAIIHTILTWAYFLLSRDFLCWKLGMRVSLHLTSKEYHNLMVNITCKNLLVLKWWKRFHCHLNRNDLHLCAKQLSM